MTDHLRDEQGKEVIVGLWSDVLHTVNRLLEAHTKFGFSKIEASLNPTIDDIVNGLGIIDFALSSFVDSDLLGHDDTRLALNSKQCVLHIRRLAEALKSGNETEYEEAISALNSQSQF